MLGINIPGSGGGGGDDVLWPVANFRSRLPAFGTLLLTSAKAYFVYVGRARKVQTITAASVYFTVAGAGTQVGEIGVFTTPLAPVRNLAQTLTKVAAVNFGDSLLTTGLKSSSGLSAAVSAGQYLWLGVRFQMGTTQPTVGAVGQDFQGAELLELAGAGDLTLSSTFAGTVLSQGATGQAPYMAAFVA